MTDAPYRICIGFPEGATVPLGRVTACGDGLHVIRLARPHEGGWRCVCGKARLQARITLPTAGASVDVIIPDQALDKR